MKLKSLIGLAFVVIFCFSNAYAGGAPSNFVTRNYTEFQSNAKVEGNWSPFPTHPGTPENPGERAVHWTALKLFCGFFASTCKAEIYMKTDTDTPVFVGEGTMDLSTGDITPKELTNNGFTLTSPEAGLIEIRKAD